MIESPEVCRKVFQFQLMVSYKWYPEKCSAIVRVIRGFYQCTNQIILVVFQRFSQFKTA